MKRNGHRNPPLPPGPEIRQDAELSTGTTFSDRSMRLLKWVIGLLIVAIALLVLALFAKPFWI